MPNMPFPVTSTEDKPIFVPLGTYFNNRTGLISFLLILNIDTPEKVSVNVKIVPSKKKDAKPGEKGVYDNAAKISFSLSESEVSYLVHELSRNINNPEYEIKISNHYNEDRTKVSHFNIRKNSGYDNVLFSIYSNKHSAEGKTVSCAVAKNDVLALLNNLKSVLYNLSYFKYIMTLKKSRKTS